MPEELIKSLPSFLSLLTACTAGFVMLSYESFAIQNAWPIGKFYQGNISKLIGGFSILGAVGFAVALSSIWYGLALLVLGFVLAFIFSLMWKDQVQWLAIIFLIISWLLEFYI